ncbi:MAG: CotH kinase family protein [Ilumatobacter sp.]
MRGAGRAALSLALVAVAACTSGDGSDEPESAQVGEDIAAPIGSVTDESVVDSVAPAEPERIEAAATADRCVAVDQVRLVRTQSTPGGRRLHLKVSDPERGTPPTDVIGSCLEVRSDRLGLLDTTVSTTDNTGGATLVVARWNPEAVEASRAAIDALVASLPAGERIAVWAWSGELAQVVGATTDRQRIERRLDAVWSQDDGVPLDPQTAAEIASEEWEDMFDDVLLGNRSVVFIAPGLDLGTRPDIDRDVVVDHWIVNTGDGGRVTELGATDVDSAAGAGVSVGKRITSDADGALTVIDVCDDGEDLDLTLVVGDRELRDFGIGDAADEHKGVECDPVLPGSPLAISVSFDAVEREVYGDAVAIADELSGLDRFEGDVDPEWVGSIGFGDGAGVVSFDASFRGQSSIECTRRNWSIDLDGGDARHPIPNSGMDEFVLASLCNDAGYVNTLVGSSVMSMFDVWSLATGPGVLNIDGESQGVYLVIEDPDVDLRFETSRVDTILRRRYDVIGVPPDVEYVADLTSNSDESVLELYDQLIATAAATSGAEMVDALRARFDLDQYLRWTAVMSLLGSGDHIDELFFVGSESVDSDHQPITWFTVNGWDPDDLFADCHRNGRFAIDDPNAMLSCTESLLDNELFADPVVYDLFVDELERVIEALSVERFETITESAAEQITVHLDDPEVVAAMIEFGASIDTPDAAVAAVNTAAAELDSEFRARRAELLDAVAAYRSGG